MKKHLLLACSLLLTAAAWAQELPRRAFFGTQLEPVTEEVQRVMKLPEAKGALVQRVVPRSTAEAAGIQKGDVLLEFNKKPVNNPNELVAEVRKLQNGDKFSFMLIRNGKKKKVNGKLQALPQEQAKGMDISYGSVKTDEATLRTIVTKPAKSGKMPAVLFIQGVGCYSIDMALDTLRPETQLLYSLTRQGYVTMRVEKSGMGDSKGTPCDQIDFKTEAAGYQQALQKLASLPYVDAENIFIIGHSMGGVFAPVVAGDKAQGIIAYGTLTANFMEYFINSRRNIAQAQEMDPAQTDAYIKNEAACLSNYFNSNKTMQELAQQGGDCAEMMTSLNFRDDDFWRQLYAMNLPEQWKNYDGKVLALYGASDYISTKQEHQQLAEMVNYYHPGNGTFAVAPNADHGMSYATSFVEARKNPGRFNAEVVKIMSDWMKQNQQVQ
ncbi:MAG: PDZ domain-containing protein [Hymenobacteraceae bacterium]|nr:PDZ domain-containing protein [Hymenobacteraceae bacterium]